jgi:glycosyltransferase involved in cell wall biosynthesis
VIIPCYNGARFLADAVASIRDQTYPAVEILIIDDGSTDDSAKIIAALGQDIRYVYQANKGLPGARNTGLAHARGELITFLDVDDVYVKDKIPLQVRLFENNPDLEIVIGYQQKMKLIGHQADRPVFTAYKEPAPALNMGCALIARSVFDTVGSFDENRSYSDDWDWFMRVREAGIVIKAHADVVLQYRRHEENMTNDEQIGNAHTLRMLKDSLERRRRQQGGPARSLPSLLIKD